MHCDEGARPSTTTPEEEAARAQDRFELGGDLSPNKRYDTIADPTRPKRKLAKGNKRRSRNTRLSRLEQTRTHTGRRRFNGVLPARLIAQFREHLNRVLRQERRIANLLEDQRCSYDTLLTSLAVIAPKMRRLLQEQSNLWLSVPSRKPGRRSELVPVDNEAYLAWAQCGEEILALADHAIKNLTFESAFRLHAMIRHHSEYGVIPSAEQIASLVTDPDIALFRDEAELGSEAPHIQAIAATGKAVPMPLPDAWLKSDEQLGLERNLRREQAAIDKENAERDAQVEMATPAAEHGLDISVPFTAAQIHTLSPDQLVSRAVYLGGLDPTTVQPETYAALTVEHGQLTHRHKILTDGSTQ